MWAASRRCTSCTSTSSLLLDDTTGAEAARRFPGVAAHLLACDPCAEDFDGLLLAVQADPSA